MPRRNSILLLTIVVVAVAWAGWDVGVDTVLYTDTLVYSVIPDLTIYPVLRNYGTEPVGNFDYGWRIDSAGVVVEDGSRLFTRTIPPGDTALIYLFAEWPNFNRYVYCYIDMAVYTELAGDEDRSNDTFRLRFWFSTALLGDTFVSHDYCWVSEVDGLIDREEYVWHHDISDFAGRAGARRPRTSVFVYTGYSNRCWFGVDVPALADRRGGDRVLCYADVDGDRQWEPDSSEGLYTVEVRNGTDSCFFTPMPVARRVRVPRWSPHRAMAAATCSSRSATRSTGTHGGTRTARCRCGAGIRAGAGGLRASTLRTSRTRKATECLPGRRWRWRRTGLGVALDHCLSPSARGRCGYRASKPQSFSTSPAGRSWTSSRARTTSGASRPESTS